MQSVASSLFPMKRRGAGLVLGLLAAFLLVALPAHAQLNGNYTVGGASPNYASIDLAVAALNSGVSGPVTFLIRTGTYVPPTNGWRLFAAAGMSATNKVTFKPDVGASVVITGNTGTTTQTGPFTLDGGRYYVIDGSNTNGGTTKNMTIISTEINYNPAIMIKNDADFNVVKNCNLQSAATSGTSYYGYGVVFFGPTTTTSGNDSNVIQNCTIGDPTGVNRCYCGVGFYGQSTGTYMNVGNKIIGCDIINFRFYGIWHYDYSIGTLIQKNQIHMTVPGQSTAMYAIYIQNTSGVSANPIIDSNKIYKILGAPTTGSQTIVGIYTSLSSIPSGTVQITNNMISFFEDGYIYYYPMQLNNNYSSTSSTLTYNIYYNSIYTGGTATSFAQTFAIYYYAYNSSGIGAASLCNQRDNIYYSTRAGGTSTSYGMYIYQSPFIAGAFTSNNNLIQLNTDFNYYTAYFNFSLYTTLPSYQTSGQDLQSYGTNPQFVDPNNCDLHIQAGKRTVVEGRAAVLAGQTTDYDGQARSGSTPDIGCDEGTFLATIPLDATADRFLPPLVPNATLKSNTTFTPIGFFSNLSSTTQTIPVRTRILNASSTVVYNDLWNYSVPAYNSQRVVFNAVGNAGGTTALPAGVYTLEMGTELGTDGDATNNKISFTINIKDPLNGIYTINKLGAGVRNYTSFTGAIGDLNVVGVSAAVTFKVATGIYDSTTETFPLVLKPAAGASSTNTVTFKNDSLAVVTITNMSASTPVVDIVDADYVTIDGGNLATGNPRAMKIINTGAATPAVRLYSGAQFNVLKNLNLISGNINSTSGIGGAVNIGNAPTFFSNSDNQILSCTIGDSTGAIRPAVGIYMLGETSYRNSRNRIEDCDIINFGNNGNSLANGIYWSTYNDNMKVFRNRFTMTNVSNTASVSSVYVIYITNSQNLNDSISYNKIWNVKTLAPSVTMIGTFLSSPAIVSPFVVSNNMITLTNDTGQTYCIYNATAANPQWYIDHNTLTLRGNNPSTSTGVGTCFRITSTANVQLRNNLMFNERFWAYGIANYCIYRTSSGTLTSNGNYFYNANSTTDYVAYNTSTATNYQTLASWQVTGADLNSISGARPPVVDPTTGDMHIQTQPVYAGEGQGQVLNVPKDFDLQNRDLLAPDIGADDGDFNGGGLRMVYPNGGEVFQPLEVVPMQYTTNRIMSVRLEITTDNGGTWTSMATVNPTVKGLNTTNVTMPNFVSNGALIRVINTKNQYEADTTDGPIRMVRKLKLTYPNGGEKLFGGDTTYIKWQRFPGEMVNDYLSFEFSPDGGATWSTVVQQVPGYIDSVRWIVPHLPTATGLIRMKNNDVPKFWDTSDATFRIVEPMLTVVAPNGGERYDLNTPIPVNWTSQNVTRLMVNYSSDAGQTWKTVGTNVTAAAGTFSFTPAPIPTSLAMIRLIDMDRPAVRDQSDRVWQVGESNSVITVYTPSAGDQVVRGSTTVITWDAPGVALVNILYSLTGGAPWTTIATNVDANEGSRVWTVPNQKTTQGKIRIQDASNSAFGESGQFEIVDPTVPTLTVLTPNGGEKYTGGDAINITWTAADVTMINVLFSSDSGATWKPIQNAVPVSQQPLKWIAPNVASTKYLVRVQSIAPQAKDESNAVFEIQKSTQPRITVLYPNGGEVLAVDSVVQVTWSAQDLTGNVKITLSTDHGKTWDSIGSAAWNAPSFAWTVPNKPSKQAMIMVGKASQGIIDSSDNVFEIAPKGGGQLKLLTPNGGEVWRGNENDTIRWDNTPGVSNIKIEYTDGVTGFKTIAASVPMSAGQYIWKVPVLTAKSTSALVRISNTTDTSQSDISDAPFTLDLPIAGVNLAVTGISTLRTLGAYPNPNVGVTELRWVQPKSGEVEMRLYEAQGARVGVYSIGSREAGEQRYLLNAPELVSGMYMWEVRMADGVARGMMTVVK